MTAAPERLAQAVRSRLDGRPLVYYGIRGTDAEPLGVLDALAHVVSLTDDASASGLTSTCAETISAHRIDLDGEVDIAPEVGAEMHAALRNAFAVPSVVLPYRPMPLLSDAVAEAGGTCTYLGVPLEVQRPLEDKPTVDAALAEVGIGTLGGRWLNANTAAMTGPVMARARDGSGGAGTVLVPDQTALLRLLETTGQTAVWISDYHHRAMPLNINAVVWPDAVTLHPLSLQLIGIDGLTSRPFGYCGNDFGAATGLAPSVVEGVEACTLLIADWLRERGYLGAFGIDFLVVDGVPVFCELNARFQGSSRLSDRVSAALGLPSLSIEHMAAFLGLDPESRPGVADQLRAQPHWAQLTFHRLPGRGVPTTSTTADVREWQLTCPPGVTCDEGAVTARAVVDRAVTSDGYAIDGRTRALTDARNAVSAT